MRFSLVVGSFHFAAIFTLLTVGIGCSRSSNSGGTSAIRIETPKRGSVAEKSMVRSLATFPTSYNGTMCYAVNVVGGDLPSQPSACGPTKGVASGLVAAGDTISLSVPRGIGRTVELYLYLAPFGGSCPTWSFDCTTESNCSLYRVGAATNVDTSLDTTSVTIYTEFPGWDKSSANLSSSPLLCSGSLRGTLESTGRIADASGVEFVQSNSLFGELNEGFYMSGSQPQVIASFGISSEYTALSVPPFVRSVTQKPDSKRLYGLIGNGSIVEVNPSTGGLTEFDSLSCPFTTCEVPPWFQSVSAGYGNFLFGLDHGGLIYRINSETSVTETSTQVLPTVTHVSFF
jgi:hypothetical protein